jgi:hypothetical protein
MAAVMNRQSNRRRAERAATLRGLGRTWQEIADCLGYKSRQAVQLSVRRLDARTPPEGAAPLRRFEAEELRYRRAGLHERFVAAKELGDDVTLSMLNRELDRVSTRWAKLFGLDAPEQVEVSVHQSRSVVIDRLEAELLALAESHQSSNANIIEAEVIG